MNVSEADKAERDVARAQRRPAFLCILEDKRDAGAHLEALLASAPGATALGEVARLWREPLDALTCSCGASVSECPYWREVLIRAGMGAPTLQRLAAMEADAVTPWRLLRSGYSLTRFSRSADLNAFFAMQDKLFSALATVSGARLLIERTTSARRAWAMATRPEARIVRVGAGKGAAPERAGGGETSTVAARLLPFRTGIAHVDAAALSDDPRTELRRALGPGIAGAIDWRGERDAAPDPNRHALSPASFAEITPGRDQLRAA